MKKLHTLVYPAVALLAIASAASAFAQVAGSTSNPYAEAYSQQNDGVSTQTRAQVQAELRHARARNDNRVYASGYSQQHDIASLRSRADVRAEAIAAARSGEAQAMLSERGGALPGAASKPLVATDLYAKAGR